MDPVDMDMSVNFEGDTQSTDSSSSVDVFGTNISRGIFGSNGTYNVTTVGEDKSLQVNCVVSLTVDASGVSPVQPGGSEALTRRGEGPLTVSHGHQGAQPPQRQQQQAVEQQSHQHIEQQIKEQSVTPRNVQNIKPEGLQHNEKSPQLSIDTQLSISVNASDTSLAQPSNDTPHSRFNPYLKVTCSLCSLSFSRKAFLTKHMKVHGFDQKHKCFLCSISFSRKTLLMKHMKAGCKQKCSLCGITFSSNAFLKNHKKAHGANQRYKCSMCNCNCSYTQARSLDKHLLAHKASMPSNKIILSQQQDLPSTSASVQPRTSVNTSQYKASFAPRKDIRQGHFNTCFPCYLCGVIYSKLAFLTNHMKAHGANRKYKCSKCDCSYSQTRSLDKHILGHKASMQKDVPSSIDISAT
ncbi:zinc finger and SCAN domain-containing protein 12-like [Procambarus clarkii]|uniref:zinc finger and SCAN domain-containing protein 12-like n=1 Tax=Procambarus clarkii TaxID=6728 RepID=UPI00374374EE